MPLSRRLNVSESSSIPSNTVMCNYSQRFTIWLEHVNPRRDTQIPLGQSVQSDEHAVSLPVK